MPPRKRKIKPLQVILLAVGLIVLLFVMRVSTFWDNTEYYEPQQVTTTVTDQDAQRTVYICTTRDARLYHVYMDCDELAKCKDETKDLSAEDAERMGRVECRKCKD